jgi:peptidoglycan/xylan/chitin deacetylase (PgdA/CDA1 family)
MSVRFLLARPLLGLRLAQKALVGPQAALRILIFHDVPPADLPAFERLLAWLSERGRLAAPAEARAMLDGTAPAAEKVLLTFDDGFQGNLSLAETVLARHGAKAVFFVCPGLMELPSEAQRAAIAANIYDGRRTVADVPADCSLMGWSALERLVELGHEVANHTLSHRRLSLLSHAEQDEEIGGGADALTRRFGRAGDWFAYPFGDIDSADATTLSSVARYHSLCRSGVRGGNGRGTHPLAVLADHLDLGAPWGYQRLTIEGGLDPLYGRQRDRLAAMVGGAHAG